MKRFLSKYAAQQFLTHKTVSEWFVAIIIVLVVKIITMAFSGFASYGYIENLLLGHLNNPEQAQWFTILIIVCMETLMAISLSKLWKNIIKKFWKTAAGVSVFVMLCFGGMWITTTNGLALRSHANADKTETIAQNSEIAVKNTTSKYDEMRAGIDREIETIKSNPTQWQNGKRILLSQEQIEMIFQLNNQKQQLNAELNDKIAELKKDKLAEVSKNSTFAKRESDKYYMVGIVIMIVNFIVNGILMYFFCLITLDNEELKSQLDIEQKSHKLKEVNQLVKVVVNTAFHQELEAQHFAFASLQTQQNKPKEEPKKEEPKKDEPRRTIGFGKVEELKTPTLQNISDANDAQNDASDANDAHDGTRRNAMRCDASDDANLENTTTAKKNNDAPDGTRQCENCGTRFFPKNDTHKHCGDNCRKQAWVIKKGKANPRDDVKIIFKTN